VETAPHFLTGISLNSKVLKRKNLKVLYSVRDLSNARTAPTLTGVKGPLSVTEGRSSASTECTGRHHSSPPLEGPHEPSPSSNLLPDPTRAGRPWRLGLAAPPSSPSPSSSRSPPASKVMPRPATQPPSALLYEPPPFFPAPRRASGDSALANSVAEWR
jgi:hypothetical protein